MSRKLKDTDYLSVSARVRAMENRLLTRERLERMLEANSHEEAAKILSECGYGELAQFTPAALSEALRAARDDVYEDLERAVPNAGLVDVFRVKYDYHNAKVLLKSEAMGARPDRLLVAGGRYAPAALLDAFQRDDLDGCSDVFCRATQEAREVLSASGDPQTADILLDRAYYAEVLALAEAAGSSFLLGYIRLSIDAANLRAAVRTCRMGRGTDFMAQVLVSGGNVPEEEVIAGAENLDGLPWGLLSGAAALGAALTAPGSGRLTEFERQCDNALVAYLSAARRVPFGEQPVLAYLYAREAELTAIRIVMTGRMAGLDTETIRERLRDSYV